MLCFFSFVASGQTEEIFRVGFTHRAFNDVNENDAVAAVRAWVLAFISERGIQAIPEPFIFRSFSEIEVALSGATVDAVNITVDEFEQVRELVADDVVVCGVISDSITEEYVLLVNRKDAIKELSDLKGSALGIISSQRAALAATWVDTLLLREGLEPADGFFRRVDTNPKEGDLLLSLFFGKMDACVTTRRGYDIMTELNPQTGRQLAILESSPPIVPTVFCFRKGYISPLRNQILDEIDRWHLSQAGKQSLTIFRTDSLRIQPVSCLDSALALLAEHQKLLDETGAVISGKRSEAPLEKGNR